MGPSGLENVLRVGKVKESPVFASYMVCPQCRLIMSGKKKKAVEISQDLWIHKSCKPAFIRRAIEMAQREAAAAALQEVPQPEQEAQCPLPQ